MLSALRSRLTYANVTATLALFLAISGGAAYAASHYLITKTSQIKPSVLKALKGNAGPAGASGPAGPAGPTGPTGSGSPGVEGKAGSEGKAGAPGTSVTSAKLSPGNANCKEGGSEFKALSGTTFACNGLNGSFSASEPLAKGQTLTGTWASGFQVEAPTSHPSTLDAAVTVEPETKEIEAEVKGKKETLTVVTGVSTKSEDATPISLVSISFPIAVSPAPKVLVGFQPGSVGIAVEKEKLGLGTPLWKEKCTGTFEHPTAAEGFLCVYPRTGAEGDIVNAPTSLLEEAHPFGLILPFTDVKPDAGSWAVTAE